jgi:hypothetical protein
MKIAPQRPTAAPTPTEPKPTTSTASAAAPTAGWKPGAGAAHARAVTPEASEPSDTAARAALTGYATAAVSRALAEPGGSHPLLEQFGQGLGLGLGVLVTEALAAVPSWNTPVLDAKGQPATSIPGADKVGDHALLKRHQEVVGPQIAALVAKLEPGAVRDLLDGLAKGATAAPGTSYRLEAAAADLLHPGGS